jgi:hypothetical protein
MLVWFAFRAAPQSCMMPGSGLEVVWGKVRLRTRLPS